MKKLCNCILDKLISLQLLNPYLKPADREKLLRARRVLRRTDGRTT